jgi:hypothetical protein
MALRADSGRNGVCIRQWEADAGMIKLDVQPSIRAVTPLAGRRKACAHMVGIVRGLKVGCVTGIALG